MAKVYVMVDDDGNFVGYDGYDDAIYTVDNIINVGGNEDRAKIDRLVKAINNSYMEEGMNVLGEVKFPIGLAEVDMSYTVKFLK